MKNNQLGGKKDTNASNKQRDVSTSNVSNRKTGNGKYVEMEDAKKKSGYSALSLNSKEKEEKSSSSIHMSNKLSPFSPNISTPQSFDISHSPQPNKNFQSTNSIGGYSINTVNTMNTGSTILTTSNNLSLSSAGNINVISRFRPLNEKEKLQSKELCVEFVDSQQLSIRSMSENNIYKFSFDRIFDSNCTQQEVYDVAAKPIIDSVLEGFNGTILAYGQTSSGKTHTMQGIIDNPEKEGIIPRMIRNVFNAILHASSELEFTVKVSMIEIYMEKIRDLIDQDRINLNIREEKMKGIFIDDLSEHYVSNEEEVLELMKMGSGNRAISATDMNAESSRSHSIFIMSIHQNNVKDLVAKTGKLYLVDLAGSEKISKTGATGMTLEEAKTINKSLTTLGMVINNLTDNRSQYVPYRDSKLTRVLQESLGGNSKTCLIITCSPSTYNEAETLSTLRFGLRAKKIKNKPKINKEVTVAELKLEVDKLGKLLGICNQKIGQLESFIRHNDLKPPADGDFSFEKPDHKSDKGISKSPFQVDKNSQNQINLKTVSIAIPERSVSILDDEIKKLKDEDLLLNENDNINSVYFQTEFSEHDPENLDRESKKINEFEAEFQINKEMIRELTTKYSEMMAQLSSLEDDKKDLNEKLENAFGNIKDRNDLIEHKDRIIEDFETMKQQFESKEKELNEKLIKLQERLDIEKNVIKVSVDLADFAGPSTEIYSKMDNKFVKNESFVRTDNPVIDEIYSKIQEVMFNRENFSNGHGGSSGRISEGEQINNLQTLFEMMKNKMNFGSENNEIEKSTISTSLNSRSPIREYSNSASSVNDEIFRKERKKFETEKKLILKALEERAEKIVQVENDCKELKEKIKLLESKMNPDDKNYVKKIGSLEKNLEQVNLMYHQVVTQKSVLKIENQVLEKKIKKRNEIISVVEKENNDLKDQIRMRDDKLSFYQKSYIKSQNTPNNVVKVIKGGHVKQMTTGDIFLIHSNSNINPGDMIEPINNQHA